MVAVVVAANALLPIAVFLSPVVIAVPASLPIKVFEITKIAEDEINVPELATDSLYNFKYGLYRWDHYDKNVIADITIKCGLFGEGITSCASSISCVSFNLYPK